LTNFEGDFMTTSSLASVNVYPIAQIFPKAEYGSVKPMVLHYLIALDQPEKNIRGWLEKNQQFLNHSDENYLKLTPLAVCVLKQNKNMTEFLLSKGADPTIGDYKGWTPLHHAAVFGNNEILQLLIQKISEAVAKKLLNLEKGNYQDIIGLLNAQNTPNISSEEIRAFSSDFF
jgi:ankyrin repeat protein